VTLATPAPTALITSRGSRPRAPGTSTWPLASSTARAPATICTPPSTCPPSGHVTSQVNQAQVQRHEPLAHLYSDFHEEEAMQLVCTASGSRAPSELASRHTHDWNHVLWPRRVVSLSHSLLSLPVYTQLCFLSIVLHTPAHTLLTLAAPVCPW